MPPPNHHFSEFLPKEKNLTFMWIIGTNGLKGWMTIEVPSALNGKFLNSTLFAKAEVGKLSPKIWEKFTPAFSIIFPFSKI